MQQQPLLLDDNQDTRFSQLSSSVQQAALELMAALLLHVYATAEKADHDQSTDRQ